MHYHRIYLIINSDYYLSDKFKNKCIEKGFNSDCFSFIHLNIRRVPKNINQFELYLRNIQHEFSIIGLSETWLNESNFSLYNIVGYNHVYKYREKKSGGGVSMYIKESLHNTSREDLSIFNDIIKSVFIEIQKDNFNTPHNILIGTIYRPPNKDIKLFIDYLTQILLSVKKENQSVYLMGDFNLNLLNIDSHNLTSEFLETMYSFSYIPVINKPTRVQKNSATLIDNIFINNINGTFDLSGILYTDVSDHFPVFYMLKNVKQSKDPCYIEKRLYTAANLEKVAYRLLEVNWDSVMSTNQTQEAYSVFHNQLTEVCYECFPIVRIKSNYNKAYRPNAHMLDVFMQLKYQFAVKTRFRISIITISTFTLYPLLLNTATIRMQYLTILFSSF